MTSKLVPLLKTLADYARDSVVENPYNLLLCLVILISDWGWSNREAVMAHLFRLSDEPSAVIDRYLPRGQAW